MSTRSNIIAQCGDGRFRSIYCHYEGYPEGVGKTLVKYYTRQQDIEDLVALGSLSQLGEDPGMTVGHTYSTPVDGFCIAYHRDRGEEFLQGVGDTPEQAYEDAAVSGDQYQYLWRDNQWWIWMGGKWVELIEVLFDIEEGDL